eukprot:3524149-Pyramimonas_sp.AAC.1
MRYLACPPLACTRGGTLAMAAERPRPLDKYIQMELAALWLDGQARSIEGRLGNSDDERTPVAWTRLRTTSWRPAVGAQSREDGSYLGSQKWNITITAAHGLHDYHRRHQQRQGVVLARQGAQRGH